MHHVLILSLLRKINASSRERLLDLVLKWRLSAPTVLATWTLVGMGLWGWGWLLDQNKIGALQKLHVLSQY